MYRSTNVRETAQNYLSKDVDINNSRTHAKTRERGQGNESIRYQCTGPLMLEKQSRKDVEIQNPSQEQRKGAKGMNQSDTSVQVY